MEFNDLRAAKYKDQGNTGGWTPEDVINHAFGSLPDWQFPHVPYSFSIVAVALWLWLCGHGSVAVALGGLGKKTKKTKKDKKRQKTQNTIAKTLCFTMEIVFSLKKSKKTLCFTMFLMISICN